MHECPESSIEQVETSLQSEQSTRVKARLLDPRFKRKILGHVMNGRKVGVELSQINPQSEAATLRTVTLRVSTAGRNNNAEGYLWPSHLHLNCIKK